MELSAEDDRRLCPGLSFPCLIFSCRFAALHQVLYHLHHPEEPWLLPKCFVCGKPIPAGKGFRCGTCVEWFICEARLEFLPSQIDRGVGGGGGGGH